MECRKIDTVAAWSAFVSEANSAQGTPWDVVIMDQHFDLKTEEGRTESRTGTELMPFLRNRARCIIAHSGNSTESDTARYKKDGADGAVGKGTPSFCVDVGRIYKAAMSVDGHWKYTSAARGDSMLCDDRRLPTAGSGSSFGVSPLPREPPAPTRRGYDQALPHRTRQGAGGGRGGALQLKTRRSALARDAGQGQAVEGVRARAHGGPAATSGRGAKRDFDDRVSREGITQSRKRGRRGTVPAVTS